MPLAPQSVIDTMVILVKLVIWIPGIRDLAQCELGISTHSCGRLMIMMLLLYASVLMLVASGQNADHAMMAMSVGEYLVLVLAVTGHCNTELHVSSGLPIGQQYWTVHCRQAYCHRTTDLDLGCLSKDDPVCQAIKLAFR